VIVGATLAVTLPLDADELLDEAETVPVPDKDVVSVVDTA
jgi:hypothetical protein